MPTDSSANHDSTSNRAVIYALGWAGKRGMRILGATTDGKKPRVISIPTTQTGNMRMPDPEAFKRDFLGLLTEQDVVLSPMGANYTYLPGCYARGATVYWIHPGLLADVKDSQLPDHLLHRFADKPHDFYKFLPTDEEVAELCIVVREWLGRQKDRVRVVNRLSQWLRRVRDTFFYFKPLREQWLKKQVRDKVRSLTGPLKQFGVVLDDAKLAALKSGLTIEAENLYSMYFGDTASEVTRKQAREEILSSRLEMLSVENLEDEFAREVAALLNQTQANVVFDGILSETAVRSRAVLLTFIRNPFLYQTAAHLRKYAGLGLKNGQAIKRQRGEPNIGNPAMKKEVVFVMPETLIKSDKSGLWKPMVYAYKEYQTRRQWELMLLTADVYKAFGRKLKTDNTTGEVNGADHDDEADETEAEEQEAAEQNVSAAVLQALVARLHGLKRLDLIYRSKEALKTVDALMEKPDARTLWRCFTRGYDKRTNQWGLNLAMTPKRIHRQALRFMGSTILDAVYYAWLRWLGAPLPLKEDEIYVKRWRAVKNLPGETPTDYDPRVVLSYYQMMAKRLRATTNLPDDVVLRFMPPDERKAHLAEQPAPI